MVKSCINFRNSLSLFGYLYLKFCLLEIYLVFIFETTFFIKIYFLYFEMLHMFCFYKHKSFCRILNFLFIKTIPINIKQFNISMGYNLNCLSNICQWGYLSKTQIKMFKYFREKIAKNRILFLQETYTSHDTVTN